MINDNVLGDRLNAYRSGEKILEPINEEYANKLDSVNENISTLTRVGFEIANLSYSFLKSIAFGYTVKIFTESDWSIWSVLAIGFTIDFILTGIFNIFNK